MGNNIYIIGSNGYIGSHLKKAVNCKQLFCINRNQNRNLNNNVFANLPKKVEEGSKCFLLASIAGAKQCDMNRELTKETNIELVKRVCDLGFEKIVFTSTTSVYGNSNNFSSEESAVQPTSYYTETKLIAEEIILSANTNYVVGRLSIVVGVSPKMTWEPLLHQLIRHGIEGEKNNIINMGNYRPIYSLRSTSHALIEIMNKDWFNGQVVNIGNTKNNYSKFQLVNMVKKQIPTLTYLFQDGNDMRNYKVSFKKLEQHFNCPDKISISIKELIKEAKE